MWWIQVSFAFPVRECGQKEGMCCSFFDGFSVKELLQKSNHTLGLASVRLAKVY